MDYNYARDEVHLLQQDRDERLATDAKLLDAMVPITDRYASGERVPFGTQRPVRRRSQLPPTPRAAAHDRFLQRDRGRAEMRGELVSSQASGLGRAGNIGGGSGGGGESKRSHLEHGSLSSSNKKQPVVASPAGASSPVSIGRKMLAQAGSGGDVPGSPSPKMTPSVPPRRPQMGSLGALGGISSGQGKAAKHCQKSGKSYHFGSIFDAMKGGKGIWPDGDRRARVKGKQPAKGRSCNGW